MNRVPPHDDEHRRSARTKGDRIANRPRTLRGLLRWAQNAYALEPPGGSKTSRVMTGWRLEEDGDPAFTGETKAWLGMSQGVEREEQRPTDDRGRVRPEPQPNDWRAIACRVDEDGFYRTPLRCAVERVPVKERRDLLRAVLPNVFFPSDACDLAGVPAAFHEDVLAAALNLLWDRYTDRPLPRRTERSESQLDAEAAA